MSNLTSAKQDLIFSSLPNLLSLPHLHLSKWNHHILIYSSYPWNYFPYLPIPPLPSTDPVDSISTACAQLVLHSHVLAVSISTILSQLDFFQSLSANCPASTVIPCPPHPPSQLISICPPWNWEKGEGYHLGAPLNSSIKDWYDCKKRSCTVQDISNNYIKNKQKA